MRRRIIPFTIYAGSGGVTLSRIVASRSSAGSLGKRDVPCASFAEEGRCFSLLATSGMGVVGDPYCAQMRRSARLSSAGGVFGGAGRRKTGGKRVLPPADFGALCGFCRTGAGFSAGLFFPDDLQRGDGSIADGRGDLAVFFIPHIPGRIHAFEIGFHFFVRDDVPLFGELQRGAF